MVFDSSNGINRSEGIATKLGFGLAIVLWIAAIGWGWNYGLVQERIYEQEARYAYSDYSKYGCNQITKAEPQTIPVKQADGKPCTPSEEAQKENDKRRDYANLVAQRSSALWAKIMGIAALIGMGLSFIGVALVWTTFRETRKVNELTREAQRAWLIFDVNVIEIWSMGGQPTVKFDIAFKNKGNSTTKIKSVTAYCHSCKPEEWHPVITEQMIQRMVEGRQPAKKVGDNYPAVIYREDAELRNAITKLHSNVEPIQHVALLYLHVVYDVGQTVSAFTIRQSKSKFARATIKPINGGYTKLPLEGDKLECEKHEYSYMK